MGKFRTILAISILAALIACSLDDDRTEVACTEEFRMIGLKITGVELDDFYTLRVETGDTIRFTEGDTYPLVNWYPVLDDSYQPVLEGREEQFGFVGMIDGAQVVAETFVIGSDQCHIYKVSGAQSVDL